MPSPPKGYFKEYAQPARRQLRGYFRALEIKYGPFADRVVRAQARLTCEAWLQADAASGAAIETTSKRQRGTGRRPSAQQVSRSMKRSAMQLGTYDVALRRLEQMAGASKPLDLARAIQAATERADRERPDRESPDRESAP